MSFSFALLFCLAVVVWLLAKLDVALVVITFYFISTGELCCSRENNGNAREVIARWTPRNETLGSGGSGPHQFGPQISEGTPVLQFLHRYKDGEGGQTREHLPVLSHSSTIPKSRYSRPLNKVSSSIH